MARGDASKARRAALQRHISINPVLQSVKIEKYYDKADQAYKLAQTHHEKVRKMPVAATWQQAHARQLPLDHAYVMYKRVAELGTSVIPTHNYYGTKATLERKRKLFRDLQGCAVALEGIVDGMDADQAILDSYAREVAELREREAAAARRQAQFERLRADKRARDDARARDEAARRRAASDAAAAETRRREAAARQQREADVAARFEKLAHVEAKSEDLRAGQRVAYASTDGRRVPGSVLRVHTEDPAGAYYTVALEGGREVQTERKFLEPLEPEPPARDAAPSAPPAPPAYDAVAPPAPPAYDDGVPPPPPAYDDLPPAPLPGRSATDADAVALGAAPLDPAPAAPAIKPRFDALKAHAAAEWNAHLAGGRARVERLDTYQGRVRSAQGHDSTNGCAVIAPLVCQTHITSRNARGASNAELAKVIDGIVPPILAHIRSKLGLGSGAFIIPADVHDYLYDAKAIDQKMFDGVHGGNVLDLAHVGNLLDAFEAIPASTRAACAFFFKEHVTAVLRVGGEYHFVDSMPGGDASGMGTRTVCKDVDVLRCYLINYVCRKLPASYCDGREWNDMAAEFDPRVFQAFLWKYG